MAESFKLDSNSLSSAENPDLATTSIYASNHKEIFYAFSDKSRVVIPGLAVSYVIFWVSQHAAAHRPFLALRISRYRKSRAIWVVETSKFHQQNQGILLSENSFKRSTESKSEMTFTNYILAASLATVHLCIFVILLDTLTRPKEFKYVLY